MTALNYFEFYQTSLIRRIGHHNRFKRTIIGSILCFLFRNKFQRISSAAQCKNWKDLSLRHCNAYHTKDGPWKLVRAKAKEIRQKQDSLLDLKRKLRDERLAREKVLLKPIKFLNRNFGTLQNLFRKSENLLKRPKKLRKVKNQSQKWIYRRLDF